ncbi:sensor histidine kinase [Paenibacillus sp. TAB 01]|uniref:sensor histidine kinase n=1 Tax=Paenibacillus sp. TAB 01 TaxID=3368988 RepID=UPI00375157AE
MKPLVDPAQPNVIQWLGTSGPPDDRIYFMSRVIRDPSDYVYLGTLFIGIPEAYFHKFFQQLQSGQYALFDQEGTLITGEGSLNLLPADDSQARIRNVMHIPKANWTLVFETPASAVTGQISRTFYWSLLIVFPCFIMFWLVSIILGKRLHRPIRLLQRGVKQIGEGNRNVRFPSEGGDEIAELGRTLNEMLEQINMLIHNIEQEQEQMRMMELQALFSQIRPHFLLNTLNSIKCNLSLADDPVHSRQIDSLMSLLRAYMKINEPSTLQSECRLLAHYVEIMQMRNEIELDFKVQVEEELLEMELPKLLLQPLVENAFVHGFSEELLLPRLGIEACRSGEWIEIRVFNNGAGLEEEKIAALNAWMQGESGSTSPYPRIGLRNVLDRLRLTYGPAAGLSLQNNKDGGLTVTVRIPGGAAQVRLGG